MAPAIYDKSGNRRDWAWLTAKYGALDVLASKHPDRAHFDLAEIRETTGITNLFVQVLTEEGRPWDGILVVLTWPDIANPAADLPDLTRGDAAVDQWSPRGVAQFTANGGATGFGLGSQSWIKGSPATGPYNVWIFHKDLGSDAFVRFGWLGGTDHDGPCRLTFQLTQPGANGGGDGEQPPPPDDTTVVGLLSAQLQTLRSIAAHLGVNNT